MVKAMRIKPYQLRAMRQEMEKKAINLSQVGRFLSHSPLRTTLTGAGGGALLGAGREALRKPEEGRSFTRGALRGAILGGAAGAATGVAGRGMADTLLLQRAAGAKPTVGSVTKGTVGRVGRGIADFGKRQLHGFTGKFEGSMTEPLKRKAEILRLRGAKPSKIEAVGEQLARRQAAMKSGTSSIPGLAKGLATSPKATAKALWREGTGGGSRGGAALAVGVPAAFAIPDIAKGDEAAIGGRSLGQKFVRHGATLGTGMLVGGLPIIPQMIVGGAGERAAARLAGEAKR
jgi:hypothetical protein